MKIFYLLIAMLTESFVYSQTAEQYFNAWIAKVSIQEHNGAIVDFTKAIDLEPELAIGYFNRGLSKYYLQDYRGAISDYNKAIELNPKDVTAYVNRGVAMIISYIWHKLTA